MAGSTSVVYKAASPSGSSSFLGFVSLLRTISVLGSTRLVGAPLCAL